MTWLKLVTLVCLMAGAWGSFKALGRPVWFAGRRYYRQPDGSYQRWYGGRRYSADEIGLQP